MTHSPSTTRSRKRSGPASPVTDVTRRIPWPRKLLLAVRAGGRCEFDGCNEYLFEHHVTLREGNFAQLAHIVAFSERGPRGETGRRPSDVHAFDNLMLLCHRCHKQIDDHPGDFTVAALQSQKTDHEARIRFLTDLRPDRKTAVVQFKARVRGQMVDIPNADIATAVAPRYPTSKGGYLIDLTGIDADGAHYVRTSQECIDRRLSLFYVTGSEVDIARHVSLFAIGPIPLLAYLGSRLTDKIQVDLYQRHRNSGDWSWKSDGPLAEYTTRSVDSGTNPGSVALVFSLSGTIGRDRLPKIIDGSFSVYETSLSNMAPSPDFLRRRESLDLFRLEYRRVLAEIVRDHPQAKQIHIFPAIPAPVAVACGLDRLRHVQPHLVMYNDEGPDRGFVETLTIDDREHLAVSPSR
jgi:hypothetical protein